MGKQRNTNSKTLRRNNPLRNNNADRNPCRNRGKYQSQGFVKRERQPWIERVSLKESEVGITENVTNADGFGGVLKSRFSDFHVNEIDLAGKVLQLNDFHIPKQHEEVLTSEELEQAYDELKDVISEQVWLDIKKLAETKIPEHGTARDESVIYVDVTTLDKDKRTQVHKIIKKLGKLVSSTVEGKQLGKAEGTKYIKVMKSYENGPRRNKWTFPEEYVHFLVHKENMDTSEVAAAMAQQLSLPPSHVNYCGTKDKRAKTTQKFCIKKRTPSAIVNSIRFMKGVKVGNFEFQKEVLKLGQLKGNRFRIALRHLTGKKEKIEEALQNIKEHGFINYYGLQRFGNCSSIPTYKIGVALMQADYKLACELILKPRDNDLPFLKAVRETWWNERNSKKAAAMLHSDRFIEKKLLDGLAQCGEKDYLAALRKIPRNVLLLYPHAFQSLVFNCIASRRIKEFGLKLIPGDLVYRNKEELDVVLEIEELVISLDDEELPAEAEEAEKEGKETKNEEPSNKTLESETNDSSSNVVTENYESIFKRKVKALTENDINSKQYTIYDVVLPMPGYDITYPDNEIASWYEEELAKYNLTSETLKHREKFFDMAGAYRKLLLKPTEMSWEIRSYSTPDETLILSDFELLNGETLKQPEVEVDKKYEALIMDFCLPSSAYATMMLRELLKCGTSAEYHNNLEKAAFKEANKANDEGTASGEKEEDTKETNVDKSEENIVSNDKDNESVGKNEKTSVKRTAGEINETEEVTDAPTAKVAKDEE